MPRVPTRRTALIALLSCAMPAGAWSATTAGRRTSPVSPRDLDNFIRLSRMVTGESELLIETAKQHCMALVALDEVLIADMRTLVKLSRRDGLQDVEALAAEAARIDGYLRAALGDIAAAWFLGVAGEGEEARLVTHDDALMHATVRDVLAPAGQCHPSGTRWADRPVAVVRRT